MKIKFVLLLFFAAQAHAIVGTIALTPEDSAKMQSHTVVVLNAQIPGTHSRCTGTLIAKNVVLTAAHCVPPTLNDFL